MRALVLAAFAAVPPSPDRWATDTLGRLSPSTEAALDARLEAFERLTGHQVLLWIGDASPDETPETFAVRAFEAWGVGQAGVDDGLALFLLEDHRTARIEVGYGLEGEVTDLDAARILREAVLPPLSAGDWDRAASTGVDALLVAVDAEAAARTRGIGPAVAPQQPETRPLTLTEKIVAGVVGVAFLLLLIWRPDLALWLLWMLASRGGGGRGGGNGGGFGGGGGRSGGGGASGGW